MSVPASLSAAPSPWLVAPDARRYLPLVGVQAWAECTVDGTRLDVATAELRLAAVQDPAPQPGFTPEPGVAPHPAGGNAADPEPAGLAFDGFGRLYRGVPELGALQRLAWPGRGDPVDLVGGPPAPPSPTTAEFTPAGRDPARPLRATALAADVDEHLFVLDRQTARVAVLDLADGRLMRTVPFVDVPLDLAADGDRTALVLTRSRSAPLLRLDAVGLPAPVVLPDGWATGATAGARPERVAVAPDGTVWVLLRDADVAFVARATGGPTGSPALAVPGGRDLEVDGDGRVVVSGPPGGPLLAWTVEGDGLRPVGRLRARGYDGRGLVRTPDGRIGYGTRTGFGTGVPERVRYVAAGTADTPRLDGRTYGLQWGRVFVEACVPVDTALMFAARTGDDVSAMVGAAFDEPDADGLVLRPLHRRETGRELAWAPLAPGDRFEVYEAPVVAPAGRYLQVRLALSGTGDATPRIRALRVEIPGRDLVAKLPRTYRRDPVGADLLRRFLAITDGLLGEIESRAVRRDLLLDAHAAPPELLPWLGSLIGLTLDGRWPERARRTVLAEAMSLFRARGTLDGLRRLLEIYLGFPVVVVEAFRLRGRPAPIGSRDGAPELFDAVLGGGWRVAGGPGPIAGAPDRRASSAAASAHRFTVLLTGDVDDEQLAVVRDLLDVHRPAHTLVEVCSIAAGMRVGINLHAELSTYVGAGSGFRPLRVGRPAGAGTVGVDALVGRGRAGLRPGAAELGRGTVID